MYLWEWRIYFLMSGVYFCSSGLGLITGFCKGFILTGLEMGGEEDVGDLWRRILREGIKDLISCWGGFGGFEGTDRGWRDILFVQIEFVGGALRRFEFEWDGVEWGEESDATGGKKGRLLEVTSKDGDSLSELWVEGGGNYLRSPAGGRVPSDVVSVVQILIRAS